MSKIILLDYGINNIFSIFNALSLFSKDIKIINDQSQISDYNFDTLVVPGVGSFPRAMNEIQLRGFDKIILNSNDKNKKIVAICLGFQLLFKKSYEFEITKGLGILNGDFVSFNKNISPLNIGWRKIKSRDSKKHYFKLLNNNFFYHIHSYYLTNFDEKISLTFSNNGNFQYCSSILKKNIIGFQFHPEKSGLIGLNLLKNII